MSRRISDDIKQDNLTLPTMGLIVVKDSSINTRISAIDRKFFERERPFRVHRYVQCLRSSTIPYELLKHCQNCEGFNVKCLVLGKLLLFTDRL